MIIDKSLADKSAAYIKNATNIEEYDIALVLGSGWKAAINNIGTIVNRLDSSLVPGFQKTTVNGHMNEMISIILENGKKVLCIAPRYHFYESRDIDQVSHGVRTAAALGVKTVVLTNACGSLKEDWKPGSIVMINDQINLTGVTPIFGANFVDMTELYSSRIISIAKEKIPDISQGVYVQFSGPNYETPAEVRMAKVIGGDLVGMSTALEAITARECGIEICGISLVTNLAAGISSVPLDHKEVLDIGKQSEVSTSKILATIVNEI